MQVQGGYDKISCQLANIGVRNDRLGVPFRFTILGRLFTYGDENLPLEITLGRGVERVMHGTDVVGVQVITPH